MDVDNLSLIISGVLAASEVQLFYAKYFLHMLNFLIFFITEMQATVIDPADVEALESALDKNKVGIEDVLNLLPPNYHIQLYWALFY